MQNTIITSDLRAQNTNSETATENVSYPLLLKGDIKYNNQYRSKNKGLFSRINYIVFTLCARIGLVKVNKMADISFPDGQSSKLELSHKDAVLNSVIFSASSKDSEAQTILRKIAEEQFMNMDLSQTTLN